MLLVHHFSYQLLLNGGLAQNSSRTHVISYWLLSRPFGTVVLGRLSVRVGICWHTTVWPVVEDYANSSNLMVSSSESQRFIFIRCDRRDQERNLQEKRFVAHALWFSVNHSKSPGILLCHGRLCLICRPWARIPRQVSLRMVDCKTLSGQPFYSMNLCHLTINWRWLRIHEFMHKSSFCWCKNAIQQNGQKTCA